MRFALPCSRYVPRHAAPREPLAPTTRQVLAVGLAATLVPLGAGPALAHTPADTSSAGTSSSAATVTPPAPAVASSQVRVATALTFAAPAAPVTSAVPVAVRLKADGRGVRNGFVRLEKSTGGRWTYVGRLLTDSNGRGQGTLRVAGSAKLRAKYTGSALRTPAVSPTRYVNARSTALRRTSDVGNGSAVLTEAAKHVGKPYRYGATGPNSFDCSGFTGYVLGKVGVSLPRTSGAQRAFATPVSRSEARPGDLVFIPGHVGIYAGDGYMYDSSRSGSNVRYRKIWTSSYAVGRVLR